MKNNSYFVSIVCMTYNHAPYIRDALNGFCIQITEFPFIAIVIDDNSNDGTGKILDEYFVNNCNVLDNSTAWLEENEDAVIRFAKHNTNQNLSFVVIRLKYNHYSIKKPKITYYEDFIRESKYCALCEGDDYWIDSYKLAKQVAILESDPNCMMVRTNINRLFQNENRIEESFFSKRISGDIKDTLQDYILRSWYNAPCTWCHRTQILDKKKEIAMKLDSQCFKGDALSTLTVCKYGTIKYLEDVTAVYRVLKNSASHHTNNKDAYVFWHSITRTRTFFANDFKAGFRLRFWFQVCWELFYQMASRKDVSYLFKWISFCFSEFQLLFNNSKRLKIKL